MSLAALTFHFDFKGEKTVPDSIHISATRANSGLALVLIGGL